MKLARLNHILIPDLSSDRNRFRRGWVGRLARPIVWLYFALSEEGRFLIVFSALAAFAGINTELTQNAVLWAIVTGALAGSLIVRPYFKLTQVTGTLHAPDRVIAGEPIHFELVLHNGGPTPWSSLRLLRPLLPWDGRWVGPRPVIKELGPGETRSVRITARFSERGRHHLDTFSVAAVVPGALAQGSPITISGPRFLVVPRPKTIEEWSTPIFMDGLATEGASALYPRDSSELLGVRPYRPGDRLRDLHALTWSRIGEPIVREYQAEPQAHLGLIVDLTETRQDSKPLESLIEFASGLVHFYARDDRRMSFWILGKNHAFRALGGGHGRPEVALDLLATARFDREPLATGEALAQIEAESTGIHAVQYLTSVEGDPQRNVVQHLRSTGVELELFHIGVDSDAPRSILGAEPIPLSVFSSPNPVRRSGPAGLSFARESGS